MKSVTLESDRSVETAARLRLVMFRLARALRHQDSTALSPSQATMAAGPSHAPKKTDAAR